jgi:hypothetical protein
MANLRAKPDLRTVTIAVVRDHKEAQRVQEKLRTAGIQSYLAAERSYPVDKRSHREMRAVKVQVGRAEVQRALSVLRVANLSSRAELKTPKARNWRPGWLTDESPRVAAIAAIAAIVGTLILFLS